jgi:hypothetical protein
LIAAALLLSACGDSAGTTSPAKKSSEAKSKATPAATRPPNDTQQLADLIAARAQALKGSSPQAYLDTSTGSQVAKDRRAAASFKALPIDDVEMSIEGTEVEGERATLRVDTYYTFDDIDSEYRKTSRVTALKTEDGWRVSRDRPSAGALAPWEYTRYTARTSKHFTALAPRKLKVGSLMRDLEKGRTRMQRGLRGVKAPDRTLVIVARTGTDTKALTKDLKTLSSLVAVAETKFNLEGPAQRITDLSGERIFVLWRSYGNRSATERQKVIAHELVHAALAKRTSGRTPPWLYEGIAMYASGDNRSGDAGALISGRGVLRDSSKQGAAKSAMSLTKLSNPRALHKMSPVSLAFAYSFSSAAAYAIAEKHGRKALLRLISAFNSEKVRGKPGRKLNDKVVRKVLKKSLNQLETEVEQYAAAHSSF